MMTTSKIYIQRGKLDFKEQLTNEPWYLFLMMFLEGNV